MREYNLVRAELMSIISTMKKKMETRKTNPRAGTSQRFLADQRRSNNLRRSLIYLSANLTERIHI